MFCANTRYQVNVYRTIGPLVVFLLLSETMFSHDTANICLSYFTEKCPYVCNLELYLKNANHL